MIHAEIKKHLAGYLEGDLPIEERALVDAHLDECGVCSSEVDEMLKTIRLLRTLEEPELPPMIAAKVMRRIRAGEGQLSLIERISRALGAVFEPGFVLPASAIAAAALVITVVQGLGILPNSGGETDSPSVDREEPSFAAMAPHAGRVDRARGSAALLRTNTMDIVARVERRATQSNQSSTILYGRPISGSAPQIRINIEGLVFAQQGMPQQNVMTSFGPVLLPGLPDGSGRGTMGPNAWDRSDPASPSTLVAAQRFAPYRGMDGSGAWAESADQSVRDPRDVWLALGFEDPAEFARYIAAQNLAEQELWAARLADRAESRGLLEEFLQALRSSGDATAAWVADDFAAQAQALRGAVLDSSEATSAPLP